MKKLIIISALLASVNCWAQDSPEYPALDRITFHNGQEIKVRVSKITERAVTFAYPGENIEFTKSLNAIDQVRFASGRVQFGSRKIIVNGERDWEKVAITNVPEDVEGLAKKGELYEKSTATTIFSGSQKIDAKATRKIKRTAAALGAHIIYLQAQTSDKGIRRVNRSIKSGIAYGYK